MFKDFTVVDASIEHLLAADVSIFSLLFPSPDKPRAFLSWLGRRFGWYVVVSAEK